MDLEPIDCIFCGGVGTSPYHAENGYQAVCCSGCGLVFVTPRPSETAMKHLYEGQETKVDLARQIRNVEAAVAEAQKSIALIRKYRKAGRILEIGSAAGYFLREASRAGFEATGIDLTRQFVEFARDVLGQDAREGTLTGLSLPLEAYDVIYHRNVLSHLAYPIESFRRMHALLAAGGLMVFQTGNVAELPPSRWEGTSDLDLPDHLFHYGESTLRMLLARTGFELVEVQRYALIAHDAWARALAARAAAVFAPAKKPRAAGSPSPYRPPSRAPEPRWLRRSEVFLEQLVTYELGSRVAARGRRCTLKLVARKP